MPIVSASSTFRQTEFSFFGMPLDPTNRWVQLAKIIPWDMVEDEYVKNFTQTQRGGEARSARFALGTLIIKEQLNLSDQETVRQIKENPYMQYFPGEAGYDYNIRLDASSLTYFRKRFSAEKLKQLNREIVTQHSGRQASESGEEERSPGPDRDEAEEPSVQGTLILDATCVPADIQYPTDVRLLHEARRKLEGMMDHLHAGRRDRVERQRTRLSGDDHQIL